MTSLLQQAFQKAQALPEEEQDAIAAILIEEMAGLRLLEKEAREEDENSPCCVRWRRRGSMSWTAGRESCSTANEKLAEFIGQVGRRAAEEVNHRAAGG